MFDLFRSRDKAVRIFLTALLSLVALSMVAYLIPGYGGSGATANDTTVADIGKEKVTIRDVQQAMQAAQRSRQLPPEMAQRYLPQMIEQLITEHAVAYQATRMGYEVTEADTANAIRQQMPQMFPDGKFVGKEAYAAMLAQQNLTIAEFEEYMQRQLLLNRLRSVVLEGTVISRVDVEREFRRRNEKAIVEYVKVSPGKIQSEVKVSDEELLDYYNKNKTMLRIPEKRALKLVIVDPARVSESAAVSDEQVRRAYEQNKDRYRSPERVKGRHILLMTTGKSKDEEVAIAAKTQVLLKQVKGGGDFADLARKNSEDKSSAEKGGDLGWLVRGQTVPEFEAAAFSLKPKEFSNVVKTQYGYHIIQVLEKEEARLKPFDEVKTDLLTELKKQKGGQQLQASLDNAVAALKKDPQQADQIARNLNFTVVNVAKAGTGDPIPELGINRDFEEQIATLRKGEISQPVSAPGDKTILGIVTDVFPAHPGTFDEVRDRLRPQLAFEKANKMVEARANEFLAKVKAQSGDFKKAAQSKGLEVVTSTEFSRSGAIEGLGSADLVPEAFAKPAGTLFGPLTVGSDKVIGRVVSRKEANLAELTAQSFAIRDEMKTTKARERNALFEDGIRQQLTKEGKLKVHQDVMKRLVAGYRG